MARMVKNLPVMQETQVRSLGQEDLEKGMTTHSSMCVCVCVCVCVCIYLFIYRYIYIVVYKYI